MGPDENFGELEGMSLQMGPAMMQLDLGPLPERITVPVKELEALYRSILDLKQQVFRLSHDQIQQSVEVHSELDRHARAHHETIETAVSLVRSAIHDIEGILNHRLDLVENNNRALHSMIIAEVQMMIHSERHMVRFKAWLNRLFRRL